MTYEQEAKLAEAHGIKAEQVAKAFIKQLTTARRDWDKMMEFTQKFAVTADDRMSMLSKIQDYKRLGFLPYEIIANGEKAENERAKTFADVWEVWIRDQYAEKMSRCTSISEVGGMMLADIAGDFNRSLWAKDVFIRGMKGGKTGICKGDPGSGKTDFVLQEIVLPLLQLRNVLIITNICMKTYCGRDLPGDIVYAATIPDALRAAINHKLRGIQYLENAEDDAERAERENELDRYPFLAVWIVDEAGLSKDKHNAMSEEWKTQRHLTMISRKLGIFQMTIYQFDDAPDDIVKLASHIYRKPGTHAQELTTFTITAICPETTLSGILGWKQRRDLGMEYIEYDTDDTAGMSVSGFNTSAALDHVNHLAKSKAIGSKEQLLRLLEYIDRLESESFGISTEESDFFFLYRIRASCTLEAERLKAEAAGLKGGKQKTALLEESKAVKAYTRWPFLCRMAKARYPERGFFPETLKREFAKLEERYPNIMTMEYMPEKITLPGKIDAD